MHTPSWYFITTYRDTYEPYVQDVTRITKTYYHDMFSRHVYQVVFSFCDIVRLFRPYFNTYFQNVHIFFYRRDVLIGCLEHVDWKFKFNLVLIFKTYFQDALSTGTCETRLESTSWKYVLKIIVLKTDMSVLKSFVSCDVLVKYTYVYS